MINAKSSRERRVGAIICVIVLLASSMPSNLELKQEDKSKTLDQTEKGTIEWDFKIVDSNDAQYPYSASSIFSCYEFPKEFEDGMLLIINNTTFYVNSELKIGNQKMFLNSAEVFGNRIRYSNIFMSFEMENTLFGLKESILFSRKPYINGDFMVHSTFHAAKPFRTRIDTGILPEDCARETKTIQIINGAGESLFKIPELIISEYNSSASQSNGIGGQAIIMDFPKLMYRIKQDGLSLMIDYVLPEEILTRFNLQFPLCIDPTINPISSTVVYEDQTIDCQGDLIILNGGHLIFKNVLLRMEDVNPIPTIRIDDGGKFTMEDSRIQHKTSGRYIFDVNGELDFYMADDEKVRTIQHLEQGIQIIDDPNQISISDYEISISDTSGIVIDNSDNIVLRDCGIKGNGADGVEIINSDGVEISGCTIDTNAEDGITVSNSFPIIHDCTIQDNLDRGIEIITGSGGLIYGNRIMWNGDDDQDPNLDCGIFMDGVTTAPEITDNLILENFEEGIHVEDAHPSIKRNTIEGHQSGSGDGIHLDSIAYTSEIEFNELRENNHGMIIDECGDVGSNLCIYNNSFFSQMNEQIVVINSCLEIKEGEFSFDSIPLDSTNSLIRIVNTRLALDDVQVDANSEITYYYSFQIRVLEPTTNEPLGNALVSVSNCQFNDFMNEPTDATTGLIDNQLVAAYAITSSGVLSYHPHTVTITKDGKTVLFHPQIVMPFYRSIHFMDDLDDDMTHEYESPLNVVHWDHAMNHVFYSSQVLDDAFPGISSLVEKPITQTDILNEYSFGTFLPGRYQVYFQAFSNGEAKDLTLQIEYEATGPPPMETLTRAFKIREGAAWYSSDDFMSMLAFIRPRFIDNSQSSGLYLSQMAIVRLGDIGGITYVFPGQISSPFSNDTDNDRKEDRLENYPGTFWWEAENCINPSATTSLEIEAINSLAVLPEETNGNFVAENSFFPVGGSLPPQGDYRLYLRARMNPDKTHANPQIHAEVGIFNGMSWTSTGATLPVTDEYDWLCGPNFMIDQSTQGVRIIAQDATAIGDFGYVELDSLMIVRMREKEAQGTPLTTSQQNPAVGKTPVMVSEIGYLLLNTDDTLYAYALRGAASWSLYLGGGLTRCPVYSTSTNKIIVTGTGAVYFVDVTGSLLSTFPIGQPPNLPALTIPTESGGMCFLANMVNGVVYCFDVEDESLEWTYTPAVVGSISGVKPPIVIEDSIVYAFNYYTQPGNVPTTKIVEIASCTGIATRSIQRNGSHILTDIAFCDGLLIFGTSNVAPGVPEMVAINNMTGNRIWGTGSLVPPKPQPSTPAIVHDGKVIYGDVTGHVQILDEGNGAARAQILIGIGGNPAIKGPGALEQEYVYFLFGGSLYAIDLNGFTNPWTQTVQGANYQGSPIVADVDYDGMQEIVAAERTYLRVFNGGHIYFKGYGSWGEYQRTNEHKGDGVVFEAYYPSNPLLKDTDLDGLFDGDEAGVYGYDVIEAEDYDGFVTGSGVVMGEVRNFQFNITLRAARGNPPYTIQTAAYYFLPVDSLNAGIFEFEISGRSLIQNAMQDTDCFPAWMAENDVTLHSFDLRLSRGDLYTYLLGQGSPRTYIEPVMDKREVKGGLSTESTDQVHPGYGLNVQNWNYRCLAYLAGGPTVIELSINTALFQCSFGSGDSITEIQLDVDSMTIMRKDLNPMAWDWDLDSLPDDEEIDRDSFPFNADADEDGLMDGDELTIGTDPMCRDTDMDGKRDRVELADDAPEQYQSSPHLSRFEEDIMDPSMQSNPNDALGSVRTEPCIQDTDMDGLPDGVVDGWSFSWRDDEWGPFEFPDYYKTGSVTFWEGEDRDLDGMQDLDPTKCYHESGSYDESDPSDADTDGDEMPDGWEVWYYVDPTDPNGMNGMAGDKDINMICSVDEYHPRDWMDYLPSWPTTPDSLTNIDEYYAGTNPFDFASDRDAINDGTEVLKSGMPYQILVTNVPHGAMDCEQYGSVYAKGGYEYMLYRDDSTSEWTEYGYRGSVVDPDNSFWGAPGCHPWGSLDLRNLGVQFIASLSDNARIFLSDDDKQIFVWTPWVIDDPDFYAGEGGEDTRPHGICFIYDVEYAFRLKEDFQIDNVVPNGMGLWTWDSTEDYDIDVDTTGRKCTISETTPAQDTFGLIRHGLDFDDEYTLTLDFKPTALPIVGGSDTLVQCLNVGNMELQYWRSSSGDYWMVGQNQDNSYQLQTGSEYGLKVEQTYTSGTGYSMVLSIRTKISGEWTDWTRLFASVTLTSVDNGNVIEVKLCNGGSAELFEILYKTAVDSSKRYRWGEIYRLNPWNPDTDNDCILDHLDYNDVGNSKNSLWIMDTDSDGFVDGRDFDSDGDGRPEAAEDCDRDGEFDPVELELDPFYWDTDGDSVSDVSDELPIDLDNDGLSGYLDPVSNAPYADDEYDTGSEEDRWNTELDMFDTDGDNLGDGDEVFPEYYQLDGISNPENYVTDPTDTDTDGDLRNDDLEITGGVGIPPTDPTDPDTDGDGLDDNWEILVGLDPTDVDSDDDTINDTFEDPDNDGFTMKLYSQRTDIIWINLYEYNNRFRKDSNPAGDYPDGTPEQWGCHPSVSDADDDDMKQGYETLTGLNDHDEDDAGLNSDQSLLDTYSNKVEHDGINISGVIYSTNPRNNASYPVAGYEDWNNIDADQDEMNDDWEAMHGLNPKINDANDDLDNDVFDRDYDNTISEEERFTNIEEYDWLPSTYPELADSDGDSFEDSYEIFFESEPTDAGNPNNPNGNDDQDWIDFDNDNEEDPDEVLTNIEEAKYKTWYKMHGIITDPKDSDNDNLPDVWEVYFGLNPASTTGNHETDLDLDGDGWTCYEEYCTYCGDPENPVYQVRNLCNPRVADTDGDGLIDSLDPAPSCMDTDNDFICDGIDPQPSRVNINYYHALDSSAKTIEKTLDIDNLFVVKWDPPQILTFAVRVRVIAEVEDTANGELTIVKYNIGEPEDLKTGWRILYSDEATEDIKHVIILAVFPEYNEFPTLHNSEYWDDYAFYCGKIPGTPTQIVYNLMMDSRYDQDTWSMPKQRIYSENSAYGSFESVIVSGITSPKVIGEEFSFKVEAPYKNYWTSNNPEGQGYSSDYDDIGKDTIGDYFEYLHPRAGQYYVNAKQAYSLHILENGLDDDLDGTVDDGYPGIPVQGESGEANPYNYKDDDLDGVIDDGRPAIQAVGRPESSITKNFGSARASIQYFECEYFIGDDDIEGERETEENDGPPNPIIYYQDRVSVEDILYRFSDLTTSGDGENAYGYRVRITVEAGYYYVAFVRMRCDISSPYQQCGGIISLRHSNGLSPIDICYELTKSYQWYSSPILKAVARKTNADDSTELEIAGGIYTGEIGQYKRALFDRIMLVKIAPDLIPYLLNEAIDSGLVQSEGTIAFIPDTKMDLIAFNKYMTSKMVQLVSDYGADPLSSDSDSDTLSDIEEEETWGTCDFLSDTDSDGLRDDFEISGWWYTDACIDCPIPKIDLPMFRDYDGKYIMWSDYINEDLTPEDFMDADLVENNYLMDLDGDGQEDRDPPESLQYMVMFGYYKHIKYKWRTNPLIEDTDGNGIVDWQDPFPEARITKYEVLCKSFPLALEIRSQESFNFYATGERGGGMISKAAFLEKTMDYWDTLTYVDRDNDDFPDAIEWLVYRFPISTNPKDSIKRDGHWGLDLDGRFRFYYDTWYDHNNEKRQLKETEDSENYVTDYTTDLQDVVMGKLPGPPVQYTHKKSLLGYQVPIAGEGVSHALNQLMTSGGKIPGVDLEMSLDGAIYVDLDDFRLYNKDSFDGFTTMHFGIQLDVGMEFLPNIALGFKAVAKLIGLQNWWITDEKVNGYDSDELDVDQFGSGLPILNMGMYFSQLERESDDIWDVAKQLALEITFGVVGMAVDVLMNWEEGKYEHAGWGQWPLRVGNQVEFLFMSVDVRYKELNDVDPIFYKLYSILTGMPGAEDLLRYDFERIDTNAWNMADLLTLRSIQYHSAVGLVRGLTGFDVTNPLLLLTLFDGLLDYLVYDPVTHSVGFRPEFYNEFREMKIYGGGALKSLQDYFNSIFNG